MSDDRSLAKLKELRRKTAEKMARVEKELAALAKDAEALDRALELLGENSKEFQGHEAQVSEALEFPRVTRDNDSPPWREAVRHISSNGRSEKIRVTQEVRNAVQEFEGEFTQQDVVARIKNKYPFAEVRPPTVSSTLWRMADSGKIEKVREGYGSEPNVYRRIPDHDLIGKGTIDGENPIIEESTVDP